VKIWHNDKKLYYETLTLLTLLKFYPHIPSAKPKSTVRHHLFRKISQFSLYVLQSNNSLQSRIRTVLTWHIMVLLIAKNNDDHVLLQLRHNWKSKQCDSRDTHQICMKIMLLIMPTNFLKQNIFEKLADF